MVLIFFYARSAVGLKRDAVTLERVSCCSLSKGIPLTGIGGNCVEEGTCSMSKRRSSIFSCF